MYNVHDNNIISSSLGRLYNKVLCNMCKFMLIKVSGCHNNSVRRCTLDVHQMCTIEKFYLNFLAHVNRAAPSSVFFWWGEGKPDRSFLRLYPSLFTNSSSSCMCVMFRGHWPMNVLNNLCVQYKIWGIKMFNPCAGIYLERGGAQGFPTPEVDLPSLEFLKCTCT